MLLHNIMTKIELKQKAIDLRKNGFSYKEIMDEIPISKGTLSNWVSKLELTEDQEKRLNEKIRIGREISRFKASQTHRQKRIEREEQIFKIASKKFSELNEDSRFLVGISLYWAEGSKRTGEFQFMNSDPDMITFTYNWMQKYLEVSKTDIKLRLFTHKIEDYEDHVPFWANLLDVKVESFEKTIFKPTIHKVKKNPTYKGCLRLSVSSIAQLRMMKAWQKMLIAYYKEN